ncbi:hypothetical protein [Leptospira bouyouniensis]|uniref:Uncharacterized protein n=1 Tax=Leptospira bouyouniensis TaxID=2484911 RepID=A0ABY2KZ64_9LEPT|nr:hypothetical protein [Leptospira bouyouniensis]TGK45536.1 hypothetical protein EHQ10_18995 [Leptospira bouyouniensis]
MKEIVLEFISKSGKLKIIDTWQIELPGQQNRICYELVSNVKGKKSFILNDFIISDLLLFRIWLREHTTDISEKELDEFIEENYPDILNSI